MKIACLLLLMAGQPAAGTATARQAEVCTMVGSFVRTGCEMPLHLADDEALLEYRTTDSLLTIRACTRESSMEVMQQLPPLFWQRLDQFRGRLVSADPSEIMTPGELLCFFLVDPVEKLIAGKRRLIIIAGPPLSGLPFEALARRTTCAGNHAVKDLHYLVNDFEFIYQGSLADWANSAGLGSGRGCRLPKNGGLDFAGCAPDAGLGKTEPALPFSGDEIRSIDSLFRQNGMNSAVDSTGAWSWDRFSSAASAGRIVHFAAHAVNQGQDGFASALLFPGKDHSEEGAGRRQELLTPEEIRALKLNAELVVLNACRTSGASGIRDTSSIALPRLFSQAGARNVIYTLWNVADLPAERFILDFYRELLTGKSCGEALREVKLRWISRRETRLPFLWAVYVLTGSG